MPLNLSYLVKRIQNRFIFYFHNDPLSMNGSKTVEDRLFILKNVEKIIFVSKWASDRFFFYLVFKLKTKTKIIFPSVNKNLCVVGYNFADTF